jgi:hypothetical protein
MVGKQGTEDAFSMTSGLARHLARDDAKREYHFLQSDLPLPIGSKSILAMTYSAKRPETASLTGKRLLTYKL